MVASEAKLDVKILKFTTQITRAHAHHQGRVINFGASVCATKVATKCSTAKSNSTCMPAMSMFSAFHISNISLTQTFWREALENSGAKR